jgi:hypothetical protein
VRRPLLTQRLRAPAPPDILNRQGRILLVDFLVKVAGLSEGADTPHRDVGPGDDGLVLGDAPLPFNLADRLGLALTHMLESMVPFYEMFIPVCCEGHPERLKPLWKPSPPGTPSWSRTSSTPAPAFPA